MTQSATIHELNAAGEAARAHGSPLFASLPGDIDVSFEFFPPKTDKMQEQLWEAIETLTPLAPRFVSVTYGAGGSTRDEIDAVANAYWKAGVRHIVALRGDPPRAGEKYSTFPGGYENAADLVAGLKKLHPFEISVAAYPEAHPDSPSAAADIENLKRKMDAGATRAITQFFFEPDKFFRFRDEAAKAGIESEIVPGIMPVMNYASVQRMSAMCGTEVPGWMAHVFEGLDDRPAARQLVSATLAAELCRRLYAGGVRQFHFYTLNRAELAYSICHLLGVRPREAA